MNQPTSLEDRLHPELLPLVRRMQAAGGTPAHLLSPAQTRAAFLAARQPLKRLAKGLRIEDIVLSGHVAAIPLRTYLPEGMKPLAVLAYFHGGGFISGDLDSHDAVACALALETGCLVVNVDYRVLPEHPFPAAFDDAVAVFKKLPQWASAHGIAPTQIGAAGDSSGANLALAAALALAGELPLRALWLAYPIIGADFETPSYIENAEAPLLTRARCQRILADYLGRPLGPGDWRVTPLLHPTLQGIPATISIAAELDPLRSDAEILDQRLLAMGVPSKLVHAKGMPHGFLRWIETSPACAAVAAESMQLLRGQLTVQG